MKRSAIGHAVTAIALVAALHGFAQADGGLVELFVDPTIANTDHEAVRSAVERDLGRPVKLVDRAPNGEGISVTRGAAGTAVVAYRSGERVTERALDLPDDPAQRAQAIALMSGNVVRDEAAELLRQLQGQQQGQQQAEGAGSGNPPPPSPSPDDAPPAPPEPAGARPAPPRAVPGTAAAPAKGEPERPRPAPFECVDPRKADPVGVDLVPFVGLSSVRGLDGTRVASFNVIGGVTRGISGAELGGVFNLTLGNVCGAKIAGLFDVAAGSVRGDQVTGLASVAFGRVEGGQLGGLAAWAGEGVRGFQLGGLGTHAGGHLEGAQIAGIANVARGDVKGVQMAGLASVAVGDVDGLQIGSANVTTGHARVQIGLLNVADSADVPVGLVSVMKQGETQAFASVSSWGLAAAGIRHGNGFIHNVHGLGGVPFATDARGAIVFGIGVTAAKSSRVSLDVDAMLYGVHSFRSYAPAMVVELRAPIAVKLGERLSLWGAPAYDVALGDAVSEVDLGSFAVTIYEEGPGKLVRGFPSVTAGLSIELQSAE